MSYNCMPQYFCLLNLVHTFAFLSSVHMLWYFILIIKRGYLHVHNLKHAGIWRVETEL